MIRSGSWLIMEQKRLGSPATKLAGCPGRTKSASRTGHRSGDFSGGATWSGPCDNLLACAEAIIGSITTSAAITVGGLALIVLPTVIVGNELLIMAGVAAAVGL